MKKKFPVYKMGFPFYNYLIIVLLLFFNPVQSLYGQQINFGSTGLNGESINNPTSLEFGPNGKLYVSQQNGIIWEFTIERDDAVPGSGTYTVVESNQITEVQTETPNHNDDGSVNTSNTRQITGILTAGTSTNPVLYVTSSDSRIGGGGGTGNDVNLDTNSGVISRLTWNGSSWDKVDLVRGLPRCEENHSTNGLDLFTANGNTYLLVQQGGNTNQGAPSNNFAGSSEFYLAGSILIVNLTQLEQMEAANNGPFIDSRQGNTPYIYDLPTVNDPERLDIDNTHPEFPYPAGHPMYNSTIDLGDPFGGNNGLNQAFSEQGGPVQIFSPGWRNAYDVLITADGRVYSGDNGPNGGWGGPPPIYDNEGNLKGQHYTTSYNPEQGDYVTNDFNINNGRTHGDALHYVGTIQDANNTYYGGHPVPIRAFPSLARVIKYEYNGSEWIDSGNYDWSTLIQGVSGYFSTSFSIADFPNDDRQGRYLADNASDPRVNILDVVNSSTNGLCEYTATNFAGAMQGDILSASFNGNINRYSLTSSGDDTTLIDNSFLSGFGNIPLDVIAQGDNDPFPGTIWAATYGADNITIFEPSDFGDCFFPGDTEYDPLADYDGDGYTNQDEIDNGTNHCSAGSSPSDNDGDLISDLNDEDDDNDGFLDVEDPFAIDPSNGTTKNLPVLHPFWNNDPGTGFFGLGFMGLMLDTSGTTDYLTQFDPDNLSFGGAGGKATVDAVSNGTAISGSNSQQYAFQFGVNVDSNSNPFTVHSVIETPFGGASPVPGQSYGIFIGTGDQDNFLKVDLMDGVNSGDSIDGIEVTIEENGIASSTKYDVQNLVSATAVDIYISVNPSQSSARVFYSLNSGLEIFSLGTDINLPTSFLDPSDNKGMAVGIISTSGTSSSPYIATWDFININEDQPSALVANPTAIDFGQLDINSSAAELTFDVTNQGGPADGAIEVSAINITGPDAQLFNSNLTLPFSIGSGSERIIPVTILPDNVQGLRQANLELVHSGQNSPLIIPLSVNLTEPVISGPLVRISAGSITSVVSTDDGPNWESNPTNNAYVGSSYAVNTGRNANISIQYSNRHMSIPDYIDQATFDGIFNRERYDPASGEEMEFTIPLANGNYTVNLFLANNYGGTASIGDRIFDILLEGVLVENDLDLVATYGHKVAGMLSYPVSVNDGTLNISFGHVVENPLINAIEILGGGVISNQAPNAVATATPLTGETPLEVNFVGSASTDDTGVVSYSWDFGDGENSTDADPTYTYTSQGVYTATLTVADAEGLTDTATVEITVNEQNNGILTIDPIANQSNNVGETPTVSASASGGDPNENVTYAISGQPDGVSIEPTNGQIIGIIEASSLTGGPNNDGIHTVTVTASKPGSIDVTTQFDWTISPSGTLVWTDKDENENYKERHECSFVQAGDKFFMFGGREFAQTLDIYDYSTNTWREIEGSAPVEFNHFQATEYQGLIWVIGAFKTNSFPNEQPADYIWSFNPGTEEWIQGPEIPQNRKRGSAGLVVYNDKFYIIAGNTIGHSGGYVPWFDEYDPATGTWTELQDAPRPRDHFHAAVIGDKLYAASGRLSGGAGGVFGPVIPEVDVYDFTNSTWTTLPFDQNFPEPRAAAIVANFQNKLLISGGESPSTTQAYVRTDIYDPATNTWQQGADLNHGRHGTQGIVSGNGVFVAAGSPNRGGGRQRNMEFFGSDNPVGIPSVASSLNTDTSIQFVPGEEKTTQLNISGGNVGVIVKSIELTGPDAGEFNIQAGNLTNGLIKPNDQHAIIVVHTGTEANKTASLIINYNETDSRSIALNVTGTGGNQAPVAVASADIQSGIVPLEVAFIGSNSTDDSAIVSYLWDFQDGNTSNLVDPTHIFNQIGIYQVLLTVTDAEGLTDSTTVTINVSDVPVNQPPVAVISATPISGTVPLAVSFNGSNSTDDTGITSYSWDFQDGTTSTDMNPSHTFTASGSYIVTLTVVDEGSLSNTSSITIEVSDPLPPTLSVSPTSLNFGQSAINDTSSTLSFNVLNESTSNETITINSISISGTNASMFSHDAIVPLNIAGQGSSDISVTFLPDDVIGTKSATLELVHSGDNSPTTINLSAELSDPNQAQPVVRISVGSLSSVSATDDGPDWESNPVNNAYSGTSYSVNTGRNGNTYFQFANRDSSLPAYIDATTFAGLFNRERYDPASGDEMEFSIPLADGNYIVNLFMGNNFGGTSEPGERVFDVLLEGILVDDNLDLAAAFGHKVAAMKSYSVEVTDGVLNISFGHEIENPLINAIEIISNGAIGNQSPAAVASASTLQGLAPLEVNFIGDNSTDDVGITSYLWDFGDGNTSNLANPTNTFVSTGTFGVSLTVTDEEGLTDTTNLSVIVSDPGFIDINDVTISEQNGTATFDVILTGVVPGGFSLDFTTQSNTATSPDDFTETSGSVNFTGTNGEIQSVTVTIIDDDILEPTESFFLNLSTSSSLVILNDNQGVGTITDNDSASVAVNDVTIAENGNEAVFMILLNGNVQNGFTVDYATADNTALAPDDYIQTNGTLNFAGQDGESLFVTIPIIDDTQLGETINFFLNIGNLSNALVTIADSQGMASILDDDAANISINDVSVNEDEGIASFSVTLVNDVQGGFTVDYQTTANTANFSEDFETANGTLAFVGTSGETQQVEVTIVDDTADENDETYFVELSNISNSLVTILDAQGIGTIIDNDLPPNEAPVAVVSSNVVSGLVPLVVDFTGSASFDDVGVVSYLWDFQDGNTSNLTNPTHTFTTVGTYNVSLTVTDVEGLEDTTSMSITVNDPSQADLIPLVRISVGSLTNVVSTDNGPDWESNPSNNAYSGASYDVNTGRNGNSYFSYGNRDSSLPAYIDETLFGGLFNRERYDPSSGEEMEFSIPLPNGNYTVNLYMGNNYNGTNNIGDRVFDILLEDVVVEDNLDLVAAYGHKVAGMRSYDVTVSDGVLSIAFGHEVENPVLNAIEVLGPATSTSRSIDEENSTVVETISNVENSNLDFSFKVYPNPASEEVFVTIENDKIKEVYIHDMIGRLVKHITAKELFNNHSNKFRVSLSSYQEGVHLMTIQTIGGKTINKRILIRK